MQYTDYMCTYMLDKFGSRYHWLDQQELDQGKKLVHSQPHCSHLKEQTTMVFISIIHWLEYSTFIIEGETRTIYCTYDRLYTSQQILNKILSNLDLNPGPKFLNAILRRV